MANFPSKFLIVGKSKTGKSTLLSAIAAHLKRRPTYICNAPRSALLGKNKLKKVRCIKPEEIPRCKSGCALFVEDVIFLPKTILDSIRVVLCQDCHHKDIICGIVTHHYFKTSLFTCIPFFDVIYITAAKTNAQLIRILATSFQMDQKEKKELLQKFFEADFKIGAYFGFNPETMELTYYSSVSEVIQYPFGKRRFDGCEKKKIKPADEDIVSAIKQFGIFTNKSMQGVATLIATNAPAGMLDLKDLSMTFAFRKDGKKKKIKISLVDYIFAITSYKNEREFSQSYLAKLKCFHNVISKFCNIPNALVKNPAFGDTK